MVNSIIGSGIFGLPSGVGGLLGPVSPWAVLAAGAAMAIIIACFAEVASQFTETGGAYIYAQAAFGRLIGIEVGWLLLVGQIAAPAASANLFVNYLGEFCPQVMTPVPRSVILTLLIGVLALVNYRGVRGAARISNFFTAAKLIPLAIVVIAGSVYLLHPHTAPAPVSLPFAARAWLKAVFLMFFAYGGFETGLAPMGEAKDPRRDSAFALFAALVTCALIYTAIQWIVVGVLPEAAHSDRPLADAARIIIGPGGAALVAIGALISTYGYLSAKVLAMPRVSFALAERGDFPSMLGAIHPRFFTPYVSILFFSFMVWLLALFGSFSWNVTLSVFARLFYYGVVCAALPMLRKKHPNWARARVSGGPVFAAFGVVICLTLMTQINLSGSLILAAVIVAAFFNWAWVRRRNSFALPERPTTPL